MDIFTILKDDFKIENLEISMNIMVKMYDMLHTLVQFHHIKLELVFKNFELYKDLKIQDVDGYDVKIIDLVDLECRNRKKKYDIDKNTFISKLNWDILLSSCITKLTCTVDKSTSWMRREDRFPFNCAFYNNANVESWDDENHEYTIINENGINLKNFTEILYRLKKYKYVDNYDRNNDEFVHFDNALIDDKDSSHIIFQIYFTYSS